MECPYYNLTYLCVGHLPKWIAWPEAVWHCGPRGDLWPVSLLQPFVQHTLLFPGLIHSGRVRRLIGAAPGDLYVGKQFYTQEEKTFADTLVKLEDAKASHLKLSITDGGDAKRCYRI